MSGKTVALSLVSGAAIGALALGGVLLATDSLAPMTDAAGRNEIARNGNVQGRLYDGDPAAEAGLVAAEDSRIVYVRTVASAAEWQFDTTQTPYRFRTGNTLTLALTPRSEPYTTEDLADLLPETFVEQEPGVYMLSENLAILAGATLDLGGPLTVRLESTAESFVSIVSLGGGVNIHGTEGAPVTVTSWDPTAGAADQTTADGRAYLRAIGGITTVDHAAFADLGFWSGNTGGVALTGSDGITPTAQAEAEQPADSPAGAPVLPSEELDAFAIERAADSGVVSATVSNSSFDRNAFGLFVTRAEGITISNSTIADSLIDGLVLHRYVTGAAVDGVVSNGNAVDGISVARSSSSLAFSAVEASDNGRNGISIDGNPLADGPSASGTPVASYGDTWIDKSTFASNGRYGVELMGGHDLSVTASTISDNEIGVAATGAATAVSIEGNTFRGAARQAIAVREGVTDAVVRANKIAGSQTGVYVRNAQAEIVDNRFSAITRHAVTLAADSADSTVVTNTVAGSGTTAFHTDPESKAAVMRGNDTSEWHPAVTPASVAGAIFQPLTVVWLALAALLVITAIARGRHPHGIRDPYANAAPLSTLTRGVVPVESLRGHSK